MLASKASSFIAISEVRNVSDFLCITAFGGTEVFQKSVHGR